MVFSTGSDPHLHSKKPQTPYIPLQVSRDTCKGRHYQADVCLVLADRYYLFVIEGGEGNGGCVDDCY